VRDSFWFLVAGGAAAGK